MPNHIQNRLTLTGEAKAIKALRKHIASKDENGKPIPIDFNKIIPMPEILKDNQPHLGVIEAANFAMGKTTILDLEVRHENAAEAFKRRDYGTAASVLEQQNLMRFLRQGPYPKDYADVDFENFIKCCRAIKETGYTYWHDFATQAWGTKWNAYQQNDERDTDAMIHFQTAWSVPFPVIRTLAEQFPDVTLKIEWADEDSGSNTGRVTLRGEEVLEDNRPENNSDAAWELYFDLHPDSKNNFVLVDGKYEYKDE